MTTWFQNLNLNDKRVDIAVQNGMITAIKDHNATRSGVDYGGALVLPPFNDPHIHLDAVLTAGTPRHNASGELFEGINIWRDRKQQLTEADFISRTDQLLQRYIQNGVQNIRAHLDVTGNDVAIITWACRQKVKWRDRVNIQIVAFPQDGVLSTPHGKTNMEQAIVAGADVLGGIPHYEFSYQLGCEAITWVLDQAKAHNLLVDMHCDEIDDGNSRFLEHLAAETWKRKLTGRVTASHTTAFGRYNEAYVARLWRVLQVAKIHFIANPLVNAHLGGRFDSERRGRGVTRVKELLARGLNVAFGHDDVQDPWYSLGDGNMMQVLFMGIHLCHLTGMDDIRKTLALITTNSARLMQLKDYGIAVGHPAHFIILDETNQYDAVRKIARVRANIRFGKKIN